MYVIPMVYINPNNERRIPDMKTIRKGTDLKEEIQKSTECGNFVATPRGPGNCCNRNHTGFCCNG